MSSYAPKVLPNEILFDSLDYAAIDPQDLLSDHRTLRNLSLVSKNIGRYAQKKLFYTVFLHKNRQALAFGSAVNPGTAKGRWLARLVHTLTVLIHPEVDGLTQQLFTAALLACPCLRELDLTAPSFNMSRFSIMFIERASPIEVLRVAVPVRTGPALLRTFPSLRYVEFRGTGVWGVPQGSAPPCQLVELHWPGQVDEVLLWILQQSIGTLEILGLHEGTWLIDDYSFERLMRAHGASLRSLHLCFLSDSQATSFKYCTQLEEFVYENYNLTCSEAFSATVLNLLPKTLQHLQVHTKASISPTDENCSHLAHFFDTAPSLHTVTWVHPIVDGFKELRTRCERRGIEWRGWSHALGSYPGERQELGTVKRFPRHVWLSPSRAIQVASTLSD